MHQVMPIGVVNRTDFATTTDAIACSIKNGHSPPARPGRWCRSISVGEYQACAECRTDSGTDKRQVTSSEIRRQRSDPEGNREVYIRAELEIRTQSHGHVIIVSSGS